MAPRLACFFSLWSSHDDTYLHAPISIKKSQKTSGSLSLSTLQKVMERSAAVEASDSIVEACNEMHDERWCDRDDVDVIQASMEQAMNKIQSPVAFSIIIIIIIIW